MSRYLNLDDTLCLQFEQRLLKNNNDFKDYLNYLQSSTTDDNYEKLVFLYLRLILNYNHGTELINAFWQYYASTLKIDDNNFGNFVSEVLLDELNAVLDTNGVVLMMNFFISNQLQRLFDYNFSKLLEKNDFEISKFYFEQLVIKDLIKLKPEGEMNHSKEQYRNFYGIAELFQILFENGNDRNIEIDSWLSFYLLKYIILLKSRNQFQNENKDKFQALLLETNSFEDIALYFNKIEHNNLQFIYYKIWNMVNKSIDLREISRYKQILSNKNEWSKHSIQDLVILKTLLVALTSGKNKLPSVVSVLLKDIDSTKSRDEFHEIYNLLIYLLKAQCSYNNFNNTSLKLLETNVKLYTSRLIDCKLRMENNNFDHWREYLLLNKYSKESIEYCLKKLNFSHLSLIENLHFIELGELWVIYAKFYEQDIYSFRSVIKMCFTLNFGWKDFEHIMEYWINFELRNDGTTNLLEKIIKYSDVVLNLKDSVNKLLSKSFKIWDLCLKNVHDSLKFQAFTKMSNFMLIKPETIEYITSFLLSTDKFDFDQWLQVWRNNIIINFRMYDHIVKYLHVAFINQIEKESLALTSFAKYLIKRDLIQKIIDNSEKGFKTDWILNYLDLIITEDDDQKNSSYLINKTLFDNINILPPDIFISKWLELLSNLKNKTLDDDFLFQISNKQFPVIITSLGNDVLINSNFFIEYIRFESSFLLNEQRIRDIYIFAVNLLPPSFNIHTEELWNSWQEFELKHGHLKDLIKLKKHLTVKFKNMGYNKRSETEKKIITGEEMENGVQFISGGLIGSAKKQKMMDVQVEIKQEKSIQ